MKYTIGIVAAAVLMLGIAGWHLLSNKATVSDVPTEAAVVEPTLTIATSFYPLQFAVEAIAGDLANVINVGEGQDPHDVQLSTQDVLALQQSDLVVIQGSDLEPWGDDITELLVSEEVPVFVATDGLELREGGHADHGDEHEDEHEEGDHEGEEEEHEDEEDGDEHEGEEEDEHGEFDPHTWLDPVLFSESVDNLAEAIVALDAANAAIYRANAAALKVDLAEIHRAYESRLAGCTLDEVITSHDAFGYLGDRYGFEIHAIVGMNTQDLPSATVLAELKEEAEEGIGAILLEDSSVTAYGETLARETGLETLSINPIAFNIPEGGDYLSEMRANLDSIAEALACDV